jgi:thiamine kinase-like enzyme
MAWRKHKFFRKFPTRVKTARRYISNKDNRRRIVSKLKQIHHETAVAAHKTKQVANTIANHIEKLPAPMRSHNTIKKIMKTVYSVGKHATKAITIADKARQVATSLQGVGVGLML